MNGRDQHDLDKDLAVFDKYDMSEHTREEIRDFMQAKIKYLKDPTVYDDRIEMIRTFEIAYTSLKTDRACRKFSEHDLAVLKRLLQNGL